MKAGKYTIKELFLNRYIDQIIIPEIQRDYVWGKEQVIGLLKSIQLDCERFSESASNVTVDTDDDSFRDALTEFYKKQKYSSNIGFIYAYNDAEYPGKYFLIDGQQRITTIYLLLLSLASKNTNAKKSFEKIYLDRTRLKLDYKVRQASHDFIGKFFNFILSGGDDVENESWYYDEYRDDKTIASIIRNFKAINNQLRQELFANLDFFNYVQDYVEFWYFDTNISAQGEELYIYMNARGEQMQENENLKADLLGKLRKEHINRYSQRNDYKFERSVEGIKKYWGTKWEEWQDFFWAKRGENENCDNGFNELLTCIAGLENSLNDTRTDCFYENDQFENSEENGGCGSALSVKYSDLRDSFRNDQFELIETYINCLNYIEKHQQQFASRYNYCGWLRTCIEEIWSIFNNDKTNWFANYNDNNRSTERNKMVFIWSILYYFKEMTVEGREDCNELFRVLRFFYVRYNNNNRSVSTLKNTVDLMLINGVFDPENASNQLSVIVDDPQEETDREFRTTEEKIKYSFLSKNIDKITVFESLIWEIEDHPLNLNGRDVGAINITHLTKLDDTTSVDDLIKIKDRFFRLFPNSSKVGSPILKNTLLHYGNYWKDTSLYYYNRYDFSNWRLIIRGKYFREMFEAIKDSSIEAHLSRLQKSFLDNNRQVIVQSEQLLPEFPLRDKLIFYSILLNEHMWTEGERIAIRYDIETLRLFEDEKQKIFNSKGSFKGDWGNADLWEKSLEATREPLQQLKNLIN